MFEVIFPVSVSPISSFLFFHFLAVLPPSCADISQRRLSARRTRATIEAQTGHFRLTVSDQRPQVIEFFSDLVVRTKSEISIGRRFASGLKGKQVHEREKIAHPIINHKKGSERTERHNKSKFGFDMRGCQIVR